MRSLELVCFAAMLGASVPLAQAAQCQGKDGAWHDYNSAMCRVGPEPTAPAKPGSVPEGPSFLEEGVVFGDLDWQWAVTLRGLVQERGYRCDTVSAVRSCLWGCDYHLDCDHFRYTFKVSDRGGRVFVDPK